MTPSGGVTLRRCGIGAPVLLRCPVRVTRRVQPAGGGAWPAIACSIALGFAADSSFRAPMAIAVIGGLVTSTVLSLGVIPAAFTLVDDIEQRVLRRFRRPRGDGVAAPA
ncbi:hypothetical protein [Luteimonas deserti]|uniref:hypothetical protein n=1 Tax=Luteimonas deserti TaxID=2752306 RepID=UPI001F27A9F4|nr:hypothetical protein [Luteimonas deserti]